MEKNNLVSHNNILYSTYLADFDNFFLSFFQININDIYVYLGLQSFRRFIEYSYM